MVGEESCGPIKKFTAPENYFPSKKIVARIPTFLQHTYLFACPTLLAPYRLLSRSRAKMATEVYDGAIGIDLGKNLHSFYKETVIAVSGLGACADKLCLARHHLLVCCDVRG